MRNTERTATRQANTNLSQINQISRELRLLSEKALTLNGERNTQQAAVRHSSLAPLQELRAEPVAAEAVAAPTKAEFDALVQDVRALYRTLAQLAARLE